MSFLLGPGLLPGAMLNLWIGQISTKKKTTAKIHDHVSFHQNLAKKIPRNLGIDTNNGHTFGVLLCFQEFYVVVEPTQLKNMI